MAEDFLLNIKSTKHCKYNINYHIVWCSKYRHKVLEGQLADFLKELIETICNNYEYELLNIEIMPEHIHLFISVPPYIAPTDIVKTIKSITAIELFKNYSDLKTNKFWGSGLWSKGYYVGTAGNVTADTIQRYIDEQKNNL